MAVTTVLILTCLPVRSQNEIYKSNQFDGHADVNLNRWINPDKFNQDFNVYAHSFNNSSTNSFNRFGSAKFDLSPPSCDEDSSLATNDLPTLQPVMLKMSPIILQNNREGSSTNKLSIGSENESLARLLSGDAVPQFSIYQTSALKNRLNSLSRDNLANRFGNRTYFKSSEIENIGLNRYAWKSFAGSDTNLREDFALSTPFRRDKCSSSPPEFIKHRTGRLSEKPSRLFETL